MSKKNLLLEWQNEADDVSITNAVSRLTIIRLHIVQIGILFAFMIVIIRLLYVSLTTYDEHGIVSNHTQRGNIYDSLGHLIATNLPTKSVYVKPYEISNITSTVNALSKILALTPEKISEKIRLGKNFVWIKRHIIPNQYIKIKALGMPGVYFTNDSKRFYSHENDFSHIVGFVDIDQNGLAGIESKFNSELMSGQDIHLSLNSRVQSVVRNKLHEAITLNEAIGGMAIIMNANNGEIVSMVSLPDFNPNSEVLSKNSEAMFHRASLGVYEMGSTFKMLTVAIGLDLGVVRLSDSFNVSNPIKLGKYKINDYKFHKPYLTLAETLIFSSNRGIAQVGYKIGISQQQEYLRKIGMLSPVSVELSEIGKPMHVTNRQWNDVYLATISYGHGIAVTALHTVQAITAVTNGGMLYTPTLLKSKSQPNGTRVFKDSTSKIMRKLMRSVVESGYGKKADVEGYDIGGKTGTAEKVKNGRYVKKNCNLVSFFGAFPIENPQYVMFVVIDEPKPNKINGGFTTGGMIAAPLAAEILKSTWHLLDIYHGARHVFVS